MLLRYWIWYCKYVNACLWYYWYWIFHSFLILLRWLWVCRYRGKESRMFCGLMSRWIMSLSWIACSAPASWRVRWRMDSSDRCLLLWIASERLFYAHIEWHKFCGYLVDTQPNHHHYKTVWKMRAEQVTPCGERCERKRGFEFAQLLATTNSWDHQCFQVMHFRQSYVIHAHVQEWSQQITYRLIFYVITDTHTHIIHTVLHLQYSS